MRCKQKLFAGCSKTMLQHQDTVEIITSVWLVCLLLFGPALAEEKQGERRGLDGHLSSYRGGGNRSSTDHTLGTSSAISYGSGYGGDYRRGYGDGISSARETRIAITKQIPSQYPVIEQSTDQETTTAPIYLPIIVAYPPYTVRLPMKRQVPVPAPVRHTYVVPVAQPVPMGGGGASGLGGGYGGEFGRGNGSAFAGG
ncbi:uncharacterized protein LOC124777792 [Schistocerca piceifrons]|uniref:uncharacterized protein LOC124777792 n=1 Tax=Schistocerca piceifrons TaxID=274613 RepID=UPI001F5EC86C|nr:uncharacterized protein LOC124777792 [Schistocerca piceifrons]